MMLRRLIRLKRKEYRLGQNAKCELCSERDMRALDKVGNRILCRQCRLALKGASIIEKHHLIGRSNDEFTLQIPANEHAILSDYQQDWPEETMKNPNQYFLIELIAWLRALGDFRNHVIERAPVMAVRVEKIFKFLVKKFGPNWAEGFDPDDPEEVEE